MKANFAILAALLLATAPTLARIHHGGVAAGLAPPLPGFTLAFDDEFTSFNGNASGTNGWMTTYASGNRTNTGNAELECYMDSSVGVNPYSITANGLQIQGALASTATPCGTLAAYPYTSGMINSSTTFYMEYGYFEMRALLPGGGKGYWPAFWMQKEVFGGATVWPPEIDEMENLGNVMTTIYQNIHYVSGGNQQTGPAAVTVTDASANWHTYAVDWEPTLVTFYVDGVQTNQYSTPAGLNVQMYMMANLAIGGTWPGSPDGTTVFPSSMTIRYIRAWKGPNSTGEGGTKAL